MQKETSLREPCWQQGSVPRKRGQEDTPPEQSRAGHQTQAAPPQTGKLRMDGEQSGREEKEASGHHETDTGERGDRPAEKESGRRVKIPLIGERLAIPLIPLVAKATIDVDMNQFSAWGSHQGTKSPGVRSGVNPSSPQPAC